ncbi:MAG: AraC family transcriptional regulator [Clostridiaceae bacterium]|nr:AraC family transcriptional regulator [Clostridiaceae bacterium]
MKILARKELRTDPQSAYQIYKTKKVLENLTRNILSDLFIYCTQSDSVISATYSCLTMEEYYRIYYQDKFLYGVQSFKNTVFEEKTNSPQLVSLGGELTSPSLAIVLSQNTNYALGVPNVGACLVLNPLVLSQMLHSADFQQDGILAIFDGNGNILACSRDLPSSLSLTDIPRQDFSRSTIGNIPYVVQSSESNVLDCTYVSLTPTSSFWQRLNTLRMVCMISLFLCMLLSVGIAVMLARRSFHPISMLLSTIRSKTSRTFDNRHENEMEFIGQVLRQSLDENHMLTDRIQTEIHTLREDFLLRAMQGVLPREPEGEENAFSKHDIELLSDRFEVVLIRVESFEEKLVGKKGTREGQKNLSFILANVFEELCAILSHQGFLISLGPAEFAGMINFSINQQNDLDDTREICRRLSCFIKENFEIFCTMALSEVQSGLSGIHIGYWQADQAMSYRFSFGKGVQIYYGDISGRPFSYNSAADSKAAQILMSYIRQGHPEELAECITSIWSSASVDKDSSLEAIRCFKYDMVNVLNKILHEIEPVPMERETLLIRRLLDAETLEEFQSLLSAAVEQLRLKRISNRESHTVCDRAATYIQGHFTDVNLNNNALGEMLNISPSYLSKLFKAQKGMALLDYLYQIRIERAKVFLQDTDQTMDEIALQVGFLNGTALIKVFKKAEGITPGAYRKLVHPT